ncbi:MAG TPA: ChbG/HpnK family deacetylase, partial [Acidobacteriaceae bacterium]|nr:ChbG/HpnK family deacetylase [Acidobacteriaceae bacterium]
MSRLIVNADDFGMTAGVNRSILELHEAGALTSTTLMARATSTEEAIGIARATPELGVGCHIVLVDGNPVLAAEKIPSLVDRRTGCFYPTLWTFLGRLLTGRIRSHEIQAEAEAQIVLLQANGLALTHVDTHKHVHMFPAVLRPVLSAAAKQGIP